MNIPDFLNQPKFRLIIIFLLLFFLIILFFFKAFGAKPFEPTTATPRILESNAKDGTLTPSILLTNTAVCTPIVEIAQPVPQNTKVTSNAPSQNWEYPTTGWNPLIAHGFGEWQGILSPDNYEAFLESYSEGYRTFEVDIVMASDGIPLVAHDSQEKNYYGLNGRFSDYTTNEFLAAKLFGKGTTLAGPQLLKLLAEYSDIRIVMDVKIEDQATAIIWFLDRLPRSQWPRLLTNIRNVKNIDKLYQKYPEYHGVFFQISSWKKDLAFSDEELRDIVEKYHLAGIFTWIDEMDYNHDYISNNIMHKRWTPTLERYMVEANKAMIWHTSDDPDLIHVRQSAGGAIITNTALPQKNNP